MTKLWICNVQHDKSGYGPEPQKYCLCATTHVHISVDKEKINILKVLFQLDKKKKNLVEMFVKSLSHDQVSIISSTGLG